MAQKSHKTNGEVEKINKGFGGIRLYGIDTVDEVTERFVDLYVKDYGLNQEDAIMVDIGDFSEMVAEFLRTDDAEQYMAKAYLHYRDMCDKQCYPSFTFASETPIGEVWYEIAFEFGGGK